MPKDHLPRPGDPSINQDNALQSRLALQESEAKNRSIFHAAPVGIGIIRDRVFTDVNERLSEIIGWTPAELLGREPRFLYVSEEDYAAVGKTYRQIAERGIGTIETRFKCKNGEIIDVLLNAAPIDRNDLSAGVTFTALDITARKRTEQALRNSEERLRLAFDAAYLIWFEWDIQRNEVHQLASKDPALAPTTGPCSTYEDVVSMVHPEDRAHFSANVFAALEREDGHYENEFRIADPNGTIRWIHENGIVKHDLHGTPIRLIGLSQNITDRKQAELRLQQVNETLEQQVSERTTLAKRRANQLQALAVELIEAEEAERKRISEWLHNDLQQMMAAAKMQLQTVSAPDEAIRNAQKLLEDSLQRSRQLSHELSPPVLCRSRLVDALQWLVRKTETQFGLHIEFEANDQRPFENQSLKVFLFRAVQELLFNIVKHAGVKNARVALSSSNHHLVITVSDQGRGFDPMILDTDTKKAGLGLLSLRERAHYIGGDLLVESSPGKGSRFTITVPLDLSRAPGAQKAGPEVKQPDIALTEPAVTAASFGIRVLFADDHKVMRQGLVRLVADKPDIHVAGEATNGRETVELARRLKPDVIVMDISMPEMDGIQATRLIKAELPQIRIIGLSMHADEYLAQAMREVGADLLVSKTASSSQLLKAIYGIKGQIRPAEETV